MRRNADVGQNASGFPQWQVGDDPEMQMRKRNVAGRHLAQLRGSQFSDLFWLARAGQRP